MPVYTVQDPETGRTVKLEGDSPPTEQELEQIFSSLPASQPSAEQSTPNAPMLEPMPEEQQQAPQMSALEAAQDPALMTAGMEGVSQLNPAVRGVIGAAEAGQSLTRGIGTMADAGYRGILRWLESGDLSAAANEVEQGGSSVRQAPMTTSGQDKTMQLANAIESAASVVEVPGSWLYAGIKSLDKSEQRKFKEVAASFREDPRQVMGDDVYESTGSPELAALAQVAPEIVGVLTGTAAPVAMRRIKSQRQKNRLKDFVEAVDQGQNTKGQITLPSASGQRSGGERLAEPDDVQKALIRSENDTRKAAEDLYQQGARQGREGRVKNAVRQGWAEDVLTDVTNSNNPTRREMKVVTGLAKRLLNSSRTFKDKNRLFSVPGRVVANQYDKLMELRKEKGEQLGKIVEEDLEGQQIDVSDIIDDFETKMAKEGLKIVRNDDGTIAQSKKGNVKIETVKDRPLADVSAKKDVRSIRMFLNRMARNDGQINARSVHQLKKDIQNETFAGNQNRVGPQADRLLKGLQNRLSERLAIENPEYGKINEDLSSIIKITEETQKRFKKIKPDADSSEDVIGKQLRKLESNYGAAEDIRELLVDIDKVAKAQGVGSDVDIERLTALAMEMERKLDFTPRQTLAKQSQLGSEGAVASAAQIAADPILSLGQRAAQAYDSMRRVTPEKAIDSIEKLLNPERPNRGGGFNTDSRGQQ